MRALPYPVFCTLLGIALGWLPRLVHGPIPQKFDVLYINGSLAVWGWYVARLSIGFWVGIACWPERWWLRGPMCGLLVMFPLTLVSLATPGCGWPCLIANLASGAVIGAAVAGIAAALQGGRAAARRP